MLRHDRRVTTGQESHSAHSSTNASPPLIRPRGGRTSLVLLAIILSGGTVMGCPHYSAGVSAGKTTWERPARPVPRAGAASSIIASLHLALEHLPKVLPN